jgi:peptidoglycan/LPS O-acetylase OafA/YrhL
MSIKKHVPALDGLRGVAVLTVVLYHLGGGAQSNHWLIHVAGETIKRGFVGVPMFFVLSGFLITGILWDSKGIPHWWRNFFARRSLRIFPLYYASLVLTALVSAWLGYGWHAIKGLWVYALYLQNFPSLVDAKPDVALSLGHYWTLAVEEQFYLLWPIVLYKTKTTRQAQAVCLALLAFSSIANVLMGFGMLSGMHVALTCNVGGLAVGSYLALARRGSQWEKLMKWSTLSTLAGLSGFFFLTYINLQWDGTFAQPFLWLGCCGMLLSCFKPGVIETVMNQAWLRKLGSLSYGLYVFHVLLIPFFGWIVDRMAPAASRQTRLGLVFLVGIVVSLVVSQISFLFFEKPILSLKQFFPEEVRQSTLSATDNSHEHSALQ